MSENKDIIIFDLKQKIEVLETHIQNLHYAFNKNIYELSKQLAQNKCEACIKKEAIQRIEMLRTMDSFNKTITPQEQND